jgi:4-hydroxyphenylpyruvate dioxygenase-like putative hemolysin
MTSEALASLGLGPIDQVAYVVRDLEASLPRYAALYGPFETGESAISDCTIRGETASCTLKLAVNRSGPVEIELIEPVAGDPPQAWHLREHGEGLHHVRFRTASLEGAIERLEGLGFEVVLHKRFGPTVAFAYLEAPPAMGGSVVELLEMP